MQADFTYTLYKIPSGLYPDAAAQQGYYCLVVRGCCAPHLADSAVALGPVLASNHQHRSPLGLQQKASPAVLKPSAVLPPAPVGWSHDWASHEPARPLFPKERSPNLPGRVSLCRGRPTSWQILPDLYLPFTFTARQLGQIFSFFSCYFHQKGDNWQLALVDLEFKMSGISEFHRMCFKRGLFGGVCACNLPLKIDGGQ